MWSTFTNGFDLAVSKQISVWHLKSAFSSFTPEIWQDIFQENGLWTPAANSHWTIMHIRACHPIKNVQRQVESKVPETEHIDCVVQNFSLIQNERHFSKWTDILISFCKELSGQCLTGTVQNSLDRLSSPFYNHFGQTDLTSI